MGNLNLNTSFQTHLLIGFAVSLWLVVLLVLIAPFDASDLSFAIRLRILPPYGIISFLGYMAIVPLQNFLFVKLKKWNVVLEAIIILSYNILVLFGSYSYYKTSIINGTYPFTVFTFQVYYPIFFILLPIIIFGRWYLTKRIAQKQGGLITLIGDNRHDLLKISPSDLICISSADNYVEISYLKNKELQKKLLRSTLKNIQEQRPELLKVHRSHIINPDHIKEWVGSNTLQLTKMQVPISKNYKPKIMAVLDSSLKERFSSQTSKKKGFS